MRNIKHLLQKNILELNENDNTNEINEPRKRVKLPQQNIKANLQGLHFLECLTHDQHTPCGARFRENCFLGASLRKLLSGVHGLRKLLSGMQGVKTAFWSSRFWENCFLECKIWGKLLSGVEDLVKPLFGVEGLGKLHSGVQDLGEIYL